MNTNIGLSYIMPVFFNQENAKVLIDLLNHYANYDQKILSQMEFVIVDDCSPVEIIIPENININYQLLRITDDIKWNQGGARNLGVTYAKSNKIILTDCDHIFPEDLFAEILKSNPPRRTLFKFKRVNAEGAKLNSPCNIFYTSKSVVQAVLAYDEEFCGNYGYEDVMFRAFQSRIKNKINYFTRRKKIIASNIDRDQSYHSLVRDTKINLDLLNKKLLILNGANPFASHSRMFLNFNYKKIKEHWMETNK